MSRISLFERRSPLPGRALCVAALACVLALGGCAAGSAAGAGTRVPHSAQPLPADDSSPAALDTLDALGRRLYAAVERGNWGDVLFDDAALDALLDPTAAARVTTVQRAVPLSAEQRALWSEARYAGICVQQGRLEPPAGPIGLRASGFLFERALLIGHEPDGGAIAGWIEGRFLNTDAGFGALQIERVETPRRDHADLELQVCELRVLAGEHKHW